MLIIKLTLKKYSPLRIFQILELKQLNIYGTCLDLGSKESISNVTNYLNYKEKIYYADKYANSLEDIKVDLENYPNNFEKNFDNVFLMNVLEHIKNYQNCLKNAHDLLNNSGNFFGSVPFLYRVHASPKDYFRYTNSLLEEKLNELGFKNINVKVICGGIFLSVYAIIFDQTKKIPLINIPILILCILLDKIASIFSKDLENIYPLGYFFKATK